MKWLYLGALVFCGCVFAPELGNGTVRCGAGNSCPPGLHCGGDNRCYQPGSGTPFGGTGDMGLCQPRHCFVGWCGKVDDGCGGTVDCGPCNPHETDHDMATTMTTPHDAGMNTPAPPDMASRCVPTTCAVAKATCGYYPDGCGHTLDCYADGTSCGPGNSNGTCGGGGPYTCGKTMKCKPLTSCPAGTCGDIPDGCSDVLHCPPC